MTTSSGSRLVSIGLGLLAVILLALLFLQSSIVVSPLNAQAPASDTAQPDATFAALVPAVFLQKTPTPGPPTDTPEPVAPTLEVTSTGVPAP